MDEKIGKIKRKLDTAPKVIKNVYSKKEIYEFMNCVKTIQYFCYS